MQTTTTSPIKAKCDGFQPTTHVNDSVYRGHEIVIIQCQGCKQFTVDARVDKFDGEMLAGWVGENLVDLVVKSVKYIDQHEQDKIILPF